MLFLPDSLALAKRDLWPKYLFVLTYKRARSYNESKEIPLARDWSRDRRGVFSFFFSAKMSPAWIIVEIFKDFFYNFLNRKPLEFWPQKNWESLAFFYIFFMHYPSSHLLFHYFYPRIVPLDPDPSSFLRLVIIRDTLPYFFDHARHRHRTRIKRSKRNREIRYCSFIIFGIFLMVPLSLSLMGQF